MAGNLRGKYAAALVCLDANLDYADDNPARSFIRQVSFLEMEGDVETIEVHGLQLTGDGSGVVSEEVWHQVSDGSTNAVVSIDCIQHRSYIDFVIPCIVEPGVLLSVCFYNVRRCISRYHSRGRAARDSRESSFCRFSLFGAFALLRKVFVVVVSLENVEGGE